MGKVVPTEAAEQEAVVQWLNDNKILHYASPSSFFSPGGAKTGRFYGMLNKLKRAGWSKGFPDLIIFLNDKTIYIEMKRLKGGKVSPEQAIWHRKLGELGNDVYVCTGFDDAVLVIEQYR